MIQSIKIYIQFFNKKKSVPCKRKPNSLDCRQNGISAGVYYDTELSTHIRYSNNAILTPVSKFGLRCMALEKIEYFLKKTKVHFACKFTLDLLNGSAHSTPL